MLQHVTLELRREDWAAAKRFWSMVGFEEVEPPGSLGERSAWVERAGTQIHFQWQDEPVAPPEGHAAVVVDDWDGVVARLRDEGFEVDERRRSSVAADVTGAGVAERARPGWSRTGKRDHEPG